MTLERIGTVYVNLEQYENALETYQQALAIYKELEKHTSSSLEARVLENIGMTYERLKHDDKALKLYRQALEMTVQIGMPEDIWQRNQSTARFLAQRGNYPEALKLYEDALDTIESMRAGLAEKEYKLGFMRNKLAVYDEVIDLLYTLHWQYPDKGYDRKAFEIFERKQGRIFLEEMGESGARIFAGLPEDIVKRERDLELHLEKTRKQLTDERVKPDENQDNALIQSLEEQVQNILVEQEALKAQISAEHPDYYDLKYPQPVTLAELQQQVLQPGELILMYNVMPQQTFCWLIGKEHYEMSSIEIEESVLAQQTLVLREILQDDWGTERGLNISRKTASRSEKDEKHPSFAQVSHELYTALIPKFYVLSFLPARIRSILSRPARFIHFPSNCC